MYSQGVPLLGEGCVCRARVYGRVHLLPTNILHLQALYQVLQEAQREEEEEFAAS